MKFIKKLIPLLTALLMVFCLCACEGDGDAADTTDSSTVESTAKETETETEAATELENSFNVTVVDESGNSVEGVIIQICDNEVCFAPKATGADGVAVFDIEISEGYKLKVFTCPEGYEYTGEAEVYLDAGITEYTLEITKVQ